jgi:hypothetical protein
MKYKMKLIQHDRTAVKVRYTIIRAIIFGVLSITALVYGYLYVFAGIGSFGILIMFNNIKSIIRYRHDLKQERIAYESMMKELDDTIHKLAIKFGVDDAKVADEMEQAIIRRIREITSNETTDGDK